MATLRVSSQTVSCAWLAVATVDAFAPVRWLEAWRRVLRSGPLSAMHGAGSRLRLAVAVESASEYPLLDIVDRLTFLT
jgi:hypothetical protein